MRMQAIKKIEAAASRSGAYMPDDLTSAGQLLFLKLQFLNGTYRRGEISVERAKFEKLQIIKQYEHDEQRCVAWDMYADRIKRLGAIASEANKSDCERCKRIVAIFTGIER